MGNIGGSQDNLNDPGELDPGSVTRVAGFYTQHSGLRTLRNPEAENRCDAIQVIHICAGGQTDVQTGQTTFMLSDFTCFPAGVFNTRDVYFVATPHSRSPVILTTLLEPSQQDVKVTVFGWRLDGNPSGRVNFDWHCCIQLERG